MISDLKIGFFFGEWKNWTFMHTMIRFNEIIKLLHAQLIDNYYCLVKENIS